MKKKLLFFGTCFFLFSAVVIFLTHRNIRLSDQNIQLSEIIKKKEEEVKKTLKELEEQKGKRKSNYRDDLPWQLNWKGATVSLVVCDLIAVPIKKILVDSCFKTNKSLGTGKNLIIDIILSFGLPPFLLAIAKYKDKSYKERYCLLWRDYWKPFVCFILSMLYMTILIKPCAKLLTKKC